MANIYEIQKAFDLSVENAGIPVNDGLIASSDSLTDGVKAWSFVDEVVYSSEQVGMHLTVDFNYNIEFIRADSNLDNADARKIQGADDFEAIVRSLYKSIPNSGAQHCEFSDGEYRADTAKDYQSYGNIVVRVQRKFRVC